jgi:hypothetical protein
VLLTVHSDNAPAWYESAVKNLPQGLAKLKAELRIKEIRGDASRVASSEE